MPINEDFYEKVAAIEFCDIVYTIMPKVGIKYSREGVELSYSKQISNPTKYLMIGSTEKAKLICAEMMKHVAKSPEGFLRYMYEGENWPNGFRFGASHDGDAQLFRYEKQLMEEAGYQSHCDFYSHYSGDDSIGCLWLLSPLNESELKEKIEASWVKPYLHLIHFYLTRTYPSLTNPHIFNGCFSAKMIEVLQLTSKGYSSKDIAKAVYLTERGVNYHIDRAKAQLNAANKADLIRIAKECCLI